MLEIGSVLDGRFEILRQIGKGGTSVVYLAMNPKLNQQWVVKEIESNQNSAATKRVLKEARLMMQFDHPSIPRIIDILEQTDATYIVMDYVSGQSLAHELKGTGPLEQSLVLDWGRQICNVLCYLHSQNPPIVYHDLKPGNIILKEPEHNIKLIDFGEARPLINGDAPGGGKTKEYAAPEQQKETKGKTDVRTDIYCFGTTMYRLLTGMFPPKLPEPVGSIRERYPDLKISKGMDNIIRKCTQINPDKRFQSAEELMHALDNVDLWDDDYLKKQKRKLRLFGGMLGLSVALLGAGIGFRQLNDYTNQQNYENLIGTEPATPFSEKVDNYLQAIELNGEDTRAYLLLVQAFEDESQFGDEQSQQLITAYNTNKNAFDMTTQEMLELNYRIGRLYFNMYTGEDDSFRARIQKAGTYFEYVDTYGTASYDNYGIASSYFKLCDFFTEFVLNESSVQEPVLAEYEGMLTAIEACMQDMKTYSSNDAAYTRLTLYQRILDMLNVNIRGLALTGVEQETVVRLIEDIKAAVEAESITQKKSITLQEQILADSENVLDNLVREYESLKRGE